MLTKHVFSISRNLKNLVPLASLSNVHYKHSFRKYSDGAETEPIKDLKNNESHNKYSTLIVPRTISHLLENNDGAIKGSDIVTAVYSTYKLYIKNSRNIKSEILQEQDFFKQLCYLINNHCEVLNISESINILEVLVKIKVPSSSTVISSILLHIRSLLGTASLKDYNSIYAVIKKIEPTYSVKKTYKALNNQFLKRVTLDFDVNDLELVCDALRCASNMKDKNIIKIIINLLQNHNLENISVSQGISIIKSLLHLPSEYLGILHKVEEKLIHKNKKMTWKEASTIIYEMANTDRIASFYNKTLVDNCIEIAISNDISLKNGAWLTQWCNKLRHINKRLLNFVCAKFYQEVILERKNAPFLTEQLLSLTTGLAYANHKPLFWEDLCKQFKRKQMLKYDEETLIIWSLHMACLNYYDPIILDKIFTSQYNFCNDKFLHWTFLKLWQKLKTIGNYEGPELSQEKIATFEELNRKNTYMLLSSLEQALGGSMYLKTDLRSKLHHNIDYVVAFRNGGYPIAIKDPEENTTSGENITYIENLEVSPNCEIVAIIETPDNWYASNTHQLIGINSIYLETLEALSYKVIAISEGEWLKISENLRVPFLMNKIKSKLDYPQYV